MKIQVLVEKHYKNAPAIVGALFIKLLWKGKKDEKNIASRR